MNQYNSLNVIFSKSQFDKLKLGIKYGTEIALNISTNVVDDSNNENSFPHKLLLNNTQVSKLHKSFENCSLADIKFQPKNRI